MSDKRKRSAPTEKALIDAFNEARSGSIKQYLSAKSKLVHPITHFYVMSRMSYRDGHYPNALMFYSMGLPNIERVEPAAKKRSLFRRYNLDIRMDLEALLRQI